MIAFYEPVKHLTNKLVGENVSEEKSQNVLEYVFDDQELQQIQNNICNKLNRSTTILEVRDGDIVRHDSNISVLSYRESCRIYRECFSDKHCENCDKSHAKILFSPEYSTKDNDSYYKEILNDEYVNAYISNENLRRPKIRSIEYDGIVCDYIGYDCPLLGYRELMFPIKYQNDVIAVLFVGQTKIIDKLDTILYQKKLHLESNLESLKDYYYRNTEEINKKFFVDNEIYINNTLVNVLKTFADEDVKSRDLLKSIRSNDTVSIKVKRKIEDISYDVIKDRLLNESTSIEIKSSNFNNRAPITRDKYEELKKNVAKEVIKFQKMLEEKLLAKRINYINSMSTEIVETFFNDLGSLKTPINNESKELFWNVIVKDCLNVVQKKISCEHIILYGDNRREDIKKLDVVCEVGSNNFKHNNKSFYINKLKESELNEKKELNSIEDVRLFDFIYRGEELKVKKQQYILLYYPLPFSLNKSVAMLIKFRNPLLKYDKKLFDEVLSELFIIMACVASSYASIDDLLVSEDTKALISIYRHEIAHHVQGLSRINDIFFSDYSAYINKEEYQVNDAKTDMEGTLSRMLYISKNTRFLYNIPKVNKKYFYVFNEILYKFRTVYRIDAKMEHKEICIFDGVKNDPLRGQIYSDIDLFDLIANNIISNAIKYSYWGTNIYIDCAKKNIESKHHIFTVINFGIKILNDNRNKNDVFKLYFRHENAKSVDANGAGIGLHVCKQLVEQLGASIDFFEDEISIFNIPLLKEYIKRTEQNRMSLLSNHDELHTEYFRLKNNGTLNTIVKKGQAYRYVGKTNNQIRNGLYKATYKITWEITI